MYYNLEKIKEKIDSAITSFLTNEKDLFEINSNERTISQNFSTYLKLNFPEWDVDCDYNRDMKKTKKLETRGEIKPIFTDISIHHRESKENHVVIEIKKSPPHSISNKKVKADLERLQKMTSDDKYHYKFGLFVLFYVKEKSDKSPILKYYQNGKEV